MAGSPRKTASAAYQGVILLAGSEEFLLRKDLERLIGEKVSPEARAFDFNEFRSSEIEAGTLWNALITLPLLAPVRVVVLHLQGELKDELSRTLNRYTANPSPASILIIVQTVEDRGRPIQLEGQVQTILHPTLRYAEKRVQWAREYVKAQGKELPVEAADYLVNTSTSRLSEIAAKLDRAMLYVGDEKLVSGRAVMEVAGVTSEYTPWDVEDAILERHSRKIFERARAVEAGGEEVLRLLAYQRSMVMQLWQTAYAVRRVGKSKQDKESQELINSEVSRILGGKKFKSRQFVDTSRYLGEKRICEAVVDLMDLEARIKTGRSGWQGYYEWIWKLLNPAKRPEPQITVKS